MHPLKTYEYLALARQRIFTWTRPLSPVQYTRHFPFGRHGTLASMLTHIQISECYYIERMCRPTCSGSFRMKPRRLFNA